MEFYEFPIILGMSSSQLTFIFFREVETTNQLWFPCLASHLGRQWLWAWLERSWTLVSWWVDVSYVPCCHVQRTGFMKVDCHYCPIFMGESTPHEQGLINTHRIHGAGIYAHIWGILMGSMEHHISQHRGSVMGYVVSYINMYPLVNIQKTMERSTMFNG